MATRRAGVISVDFEARTERLQQEIQKGVTELARYGASGYAAGKLLGSGMELAAVSTDHAARAAIELAAAHTLGFAALAKYSAGMTSTATAGDQLVNTYRLVRLALAPTVFTAASLAAGVLVEETIRLVNARAKLIDQQSAFAAANRVAFSSVDSLDTVSRIGGANAGNVRSLFTGLRAQWGANQGGVQAALDQLGVTGNVGDPEVLGKIAAGLHAIADPAERARLAFQLFGEQGGVALKELDGKFALAADSVAKYGIVLDKLSRTQISQFRQDLVDLKNQLTDFSGAGVGFDNLKTRIEQIGAAAEDMSKRGIHALDDLLGKWLPGVTSLRVALTTLAPQLAILYGQYGAAEIPVPEPPPVVPGAGGAVEKGILAGDLFAEAQNQKQRQSLTLEGQRAIRDSAEERSRTAYGTLAADAKKRQENPNDPTLLSSDARLSLALQQKSAADVAAAVGRHVRDMEDLQKAAEDATKAAESALRSIQGYERAVREEGLTPVGKIYARRDDLGFASGSAFGTRATAAADTEAGRYLDTEEAKANKQTASLFGYEADGQHIPGSAEMDQKRRGDETNKELDAAMRTWADGVVKVFRENVKQLQELGNLSRARTEQGALGANAEKRQELELAYAQQRSHTYEQEVALKREIAALDAQDLQLRLGEALQQEADAGKDVVLQARAALEVDKARLAIQQQRLQVAIQEANTAAQHPFAGGDLKSGVNQFFADAAAKAKQPGEILYDGMNSAVDRTADALGKLFTGQKANWGKMLQGIGEQMAKESAKSLIQRGVTAVGQKLGIPGASPRPTGRPGDPVHVVVDNAAQQGQQQQPTGGLFGGGSQGGGIFSFAGDGLGSLFSGAGGAAADASSGLAESVTSSISFMAQGGDVDPGKGYIVGDGGEPEFFSPHTAGRITPLSKMGGGGDTHIHHWTVDARGADIGAASRIDQRMEAYQRAAVRASVLANKEMARRTPKRG